MAANPTPNFQLLLDQYEGNMRFSKLINTHDTSEHIIYEIETNKGTYYIFEIDYISNFSWVKQHLEQYAKKSVKFLKAKSSFDSFDEYPPAKQALTHKKPSDFNEFKKFLGYEGSSQKYYFNFLAKKKLLSKSKSTKTLQLAPPTYLFEGKIKIESGLIIIKDENTHFDSSKLTNNNLLPLIHSGKISAFGTNGDGTFGIKVRYAENHLTLDGIEFTQHIGQSKKSVIEIKSGKLTISDPAYVNKPSSHLVKNSEKIIAKALSSQFLTKQTLKATRLAKKINPKLFTDQHAQEKLTLIVPPGNYSITTHFIENADSFLGFIINIKKTKLTPLENKVITQIDQLG